MAPEDALLYNGQNTGTILAAKFKELSRNPFFKESLEGDDLLMAMGLAVAPTESLKSIQTRLYEVKPPGW